MPSPGVERGETLEAVALGADDDIDIAAVVRWSDEAFVAGVEAVGGQFIAGRGGEAELAVGGGDGVGARIETDLARKGGGDDQFGRADEGERVAVGVVATGEVAVEGSDDRVLLVAFEVFALPLTDAGSAGVGQHGRASGLEGLNLTVALDRGADLLRARRHQQGCAEFESGFGGLAGDVGGAAHVLVGGVGAGANQRVLHFERVVLGLHEAANLGDRVA